MKRMLFGAVAVLCLAGAAEAGEVTIQETACRLLDTRQIGGLNSGSKISSMTIETQAASLNTVSFTHNGRNYNPQGGESGCTIPLTASAAILSVVIFDPTSVGNATIWPYGVTQPLSTSINSSGTLNEVSGLTVTLGTDGKLSLNATVTLAHYIVDLVGWVEEPVTAIEEGEIVDVQQACPVSGPCVYEFELASLRKVTCAEPWMAESACSAYAVSDCIQATGHLEQFFGAPYLYAHAIRACPS